MTLGGTARVRGRGSTPPRLRPRREHPDGGLSPVEGHYTTFGKSGQTAAHGSLSRCACFRGQSAVISSIQVKTFSFRPYLAISWASRSLADHPHLSHSIRSTMSLPRRSAKMIARSRGIATALMRGSQDLDGAGLRNATLLPTDRITLADLLPSVRTSSTRRASRSRHLSKFSRNRM